MTKQDLSEKIRMLRKAKGLRQEDVAAKAGTSLRVIKELENAQGNITWDNLHLILDVLGVSLSQILMPGMEIPSQLIVNTPRTIKSKGTDKNDEHHGGGVAIGVFSDSKPNDERNKNGRGKAGEPPHEMSEKIDEMSHTLSSSSNINNFSADQASLILEIQSLLTTLDEGKLRSLLKYASTLATVDIANPQVKSLKSNKQG